MLSSPSAMVAGRVARDFLVRARRPDGRYLLDGWPGTDRPRTDGTAAARAVVALRLVERATLGFLDPVEDAIFLTAGLRRMGFAATFHLGREVAPARAPGGFHAWVECAGRVVNTSLPVHAEYVTVHRAPEER